MIKVCYYSRPRKVIFVEIIFMSSFALLLTIIKTSGVHHKLYYNIAEETLDKEYAFEDLKPEEKDPNQPTINHYASPQIKITSFNQLHERRIKKTQRKFSSRGRKRSPHQCQQNFKIKTLNHRNEMFDDVIIERHPNLPKFLTKSNNISSSIPDIPSIRWIGTVYQESWKDSPKFLLYSAHFDTRFYSNLFINILSYYDGVEEPNNLDLQNYFCQIWFHVTDNPVAVPVYDSFRISNQQYNDSRLNPFVLSCEVPISEDETNVFPVAVSLVNHQCQKPETVLKISASPVRKTKPLNTNLTVGICGKALFYYNDDFSTRLIEWVEILKVLGVSKIFLYNAKCHKNMQKVLDFYEKEGIVRVITFHYPPPIVEEGTFIRLWSIIEKREFWSLQNIYINDCLQRNKDDFDYLGVFDSDEIPIMKEHQTLPELLTSLRKENYEPEHYFLKWKTFFGDLKSSTLPLNESDRSYCFNHNIRTNLSSTEATTFEKNGKTFYDTNQVAWGNPHKNLQIESNLAPEVKLNILSRDIAYMGHFSGHKCVEKEYCVDGNMEEETALLPIREKVVQEMNKVLNALKI